MNVVATFTLGEPGDYIIVPVVFQGKAFPFLLDTGSTHCYLDSVFRKDCGVVLRTDMAETLRGKLTFDVCKPPDIRLGSISLSEEPEAGLYNVDFYGSPTVGRSVYGVIGMRLLQKYVLHLDFDDRKGYILQPDGSDHPSWGSGIPMKFDNRGVPCVSAGVEGVSAFKFVVDTGNTETSFVAEYFDRFVNEGNLPTQVRYVQESNVMIVGRAARFSGIELGSSVNRNVILSRGRTSVLGVDMLCRYAITMDFKHEMLYLRKGNGFSRKQPGGYSGLLVEMRSPGVISVSYVEPNSPGAEANVRKGDVIVNVNGKDAGSIGLFSVREMLRDPDATTVLVLEDDGRRRTVRLGVMRGI